MLSSSRVASDHPVVSRILPQAESWRSVKGRIGAAPTHYPIEPTLWQSVVFLLYRFRQWQANLRILDVREIKTVPYVPLSHPFVERLIGTIRRECLDRTLFWTAADLEMKLLDFQRYYNGHRTHAGLNGRTPEPSTDTGCARASVSSYRWQPHCRGLYQTPMAA